MDKVDKVDAAVIAPRASRLAPRALSLVPCPLSLAPGFTLVELLVAIALFAVLMSGVVMLFVGSVRSARTSYQQIDAFEKARSALTIIQDDLIHSQMSVDRGDSRTFYGTPIGMTFIKKTKTTVGSDNYKCSRVTYVVYNRIIYKNNLIQDVGDPDNTSTDAYPYRFPEALEDYIAGYDTNGNPVYFPDGMPRFRDAYPYPLLKYFENDMDNLNNFPVPWLDERGNPTRFGAILNNLLSERPDSMGNIITVTKKRLTEEQNKILWSTKCEMWIRMLAGGDSGIDNINFWAESNLDPLDYMVTDNILSTLSPNRISASYPPGRDFSADPNMNRKDEPFGGSVFFGYRENTDFEDDTPNGNQNKYARPWWLEDRWPKIVTMSFWLMFESPYPGAPDFKRHFSLQINIPAAYARPQE
ncbi:MAG TPA: prepilin-type N-terminal cleavage/methylation domain-containing protein [Candidatus Hydrogenedentes bacterium]|nr:prepilin-type N-terminal cleavage/methylation domain-containing protein [Candidatus Hydrogenedentota bacterium]